MQWKEAAVGQETFSILEPSLTRCMRGHTHDRFRIPRTSWDRTTDHHSPTEIHHFPVTQRRSNRKPSWVLSDFFIIFLPYWPNV